MANCVIITTRSANENVDQENRVGVSSTDIQNGKPVSLTWQTVRGSAVFNTAAPTTPFKNIWLTYSPEVNKLVVGEVWGGLDPRYFTNRANVPFDMFFPTPRGIYQVNKEFFQANFDPDTVAGGVYVELTATGFQTKTAITSGYEGILFKVGRKEPIVIASTGIGGEDVDGWYIECLRNDVI